MTKKNQLAISEAISMGNNAYEYFEHIAAVLEGMKAIVELDEAGVHIKLMRLEKSIKAALFLANDAVSFVDAEVELLKGGKSAHQTKTAASRE